MWDGARSDATAGARPAGCASASVVHANPFLLAAVAILLLCLMDVGLKALSLSYAVALVLCLNFWLRTVLAAGYWLARGARPITGSMWRFHALRGLVITLAVYGFFLGVDRLPLAEAITLSFIAPLLIPFGAWALIGERPRRRSLVAAALGFAGVLVAAAGSGSTAATPERLDGILYTLLGAVVFALSLVLLRMRAGADGPARVNLLASLFPALWLTPVALMASGPAFNPDADGAVLFASALCGVSGMALYADAYGRAQAQHLAPLEYTALLWAALFGYLFFAEVPQPALLAGAALIVGAGLIALRDERAARTAAAVPPLGD